ncbi:prolipoprotein diacylglyceryl transferase [Planomonospora venezuelensis]|uniref:Phosphatidylglycerol--prolipoprotein diacylglyceryl transferase n=1 Tax=Planomonospora venezuelensis TaxID=1999 RepID=A0A841D8D4_PLAVE|nr:prolipoprotein diacylglyceryl transferase [Planomonospora venezuelensis]MBB5964754.1 prolipoprotein diacylglyceryl transferase [Planomonospora venezuelensis]GIM99242.1 prolipoprotein diacylglyceryl transferase 1 [Planomonospora venezuelensis]
MPLASIPSPSQGVWYIGVVPIRAYALCIVLGVIAAVVIGERRWRARGGAPGTIVDLAVWAVPFGLVGGRLYHVLTDWQLYFAEDAPNEPIEALFIWQGGLGIWGAIALGALGVWFGCRSRGISLSAVADTVAPGVAVAQAIGRWGNYFNQELFGSPTDLPWGLEIDPDKPGTIPGEDTYHPTFLYESIWDLALAFVLIWAGRKFALRHGRVFALYVAGYTVGRFWIEGLRIDTAHHILGLRLNQWTSIILLLGALAYFWWARGKTGEESVGAVSGDDPDGDAESDSEGDPASGSEGGKVAAATAATGEGTEPGAAEDAADPAHRADQADPGSGDSAPAGAETAEADGEPSGATAASEESTTGEGAADGAEPAEAADPAHRADQADDPEQDTAADGDGASQERVSALPEGEKGKS